MSNQNREIWKPFEFVIKWPIYNEPFYSQQTKTAAFVSTEAIMKALASSMH